MLLQGAHRWGGGGVGGVGGGGGGGGGGGLLHRISHTYSAIMKLGATK